MLKAVILVGGPQKGTRFRPLSFDLPKPLFPVAGVPMVQHLIEACSTVKGMMEIILIGFYPSEHLSPFVEDLAKKLSISIRYLQEFAALGTAGGIHHFRDQICSGDPAAFFLINGDVCGDFPLNEIVNFHLARPSSNIITVLGTEATHQQSVNYGCIAFDKQTKEILHYVEKPSTFVSNTINCGVYVCSMELFRHLGAEYKAKQQQMIGNHNGCSDEAESLSLEYDVLVKLAGSEAKAHVFPTDRFWSQLKTAGSAIYANRHYLELYRATNLKKLAQPTDNGPKIIGNVLIHPTATVHRTAVIGPNVSISADVKIGEGVRIAESLVLGKAVIGGHSLVKNCIVGWNSDIGFWSRVEGTPCNPNPNKAFSKMENTPLFNSDGRLNPSITVLGSNVTVPSETVLINSIVLPHKDLNQSYKNEIIL